MRGREVWTRRRLWVGVGGAALVVLAVTLRRVSGEHGGQVQYDGPAFVVSVVGVMVSVAALLVDVLRRTDAPPEPGVVLRQTADALAEAVRVQWAQEARLRRLQDPKPLNVRWRWADRLLTDDTRNIRRGRPVPEPRPGDNCLASIATAFEEVPSRRMVVLGSPGSGKSVLAVCCTLDLLRKRTPGTAVPVIFPLAAWDPGTTALRAWLVERIVAEYRPLAATTDGTVLAQALLDAGLIAPVLDGFDELPPALYGTGMRRLNAELDDGMPVLVTSRTTAWRSTVACSDVLTGAEVLELLPLDFAEAKSYLERTARPLRGPGDRRTTVWTPVLDSLQEDSRTPAAGALLQILTNPLMVALARTVYGDVSRDPQELLDDPRFGTTAGIEEHLLDAFVPAAFGDGGVDSRWRAADARRWLAWLARELERRETKRLAWWELYLCVPRALRVVAPALLAQALTFVLAVPILLSSVGGDVFVSDDRPSLAANLVGNLVGFAGGLALLLPMSAARREGRTALPRQLTVCMATAAIATLGYTLAGGSVQFGLQFGTVTDGWVAELFSGAVFGVLIALYFGVAGLARHAVPLGLPWAGSPAGRLAAQAGGGLLALAGLVIVRPWLFGHGLGVWPMVAGALCFVAALCLWAAARRQGGRTAVSHAGEGRIARRFVTGLLHGWAVCLLVGMAAGGTVGAVGYALSAVETSRAPDLDGRRLGKWSHQETPGGVRTVESSTEIAGVLVYPHGGARLTAYPHGSHPPSCDQKCESFDTRVTFRVAQGDLRILVDGHTAADAVNMLPELPEQSRTWLAQSAARHPLDRFLLPGAMGGVLIALIGGPASGLYRALSTPSDLIRAASPQVTLRTDRMASLSRSGVVAVMTGGVCVLLAWVFASRGGLDHVAAQMWVPMGTAALALTAWGQLAVARIWLALTRRLPWRLMTFLDEAHRRGVLRQSGAHYEFRHLRMQQRLASATEVPQEDPRTTASTA
ncbi:NACHT domain-containing protein [Streptomyces flavofungini]|uniref:NACHT domain-containing protein n=1 Tax=Streptomyces flavofungini TaxID=68200 RepID=A0ABS0XJ28_9ACTN|nr:NACHT domain-containing protein [Streptomyces flavofungini]MBJ3813235.1 NACHT domain-containing protein [Streptomyces flavofungini]